MRLIDNARALGALLAAPTDVAAPPAWVGDSHLAPVSIDGYPDDRISRETAMTVPALMRARNLICTTVARLALVAARDGVDLDNQPRFLSATDGALSPYHRMLWTADDLLFYGWSLWAVTRAADTGHVLNAERVEFSRWAFDSRGAVTVDGNPVDGRTHILIPGIHEGVLAHGAPTIREAVALTRAVTRAVETPAATVELHQTNDRPVTADEIAALKQSWVRARRGVDGGVAFTSAGIEVKEHGAPAEHLLIDGRNAVAIDIARLCGIPAPMIDASISGSSLSYSNTASRMAELIAFGIAPVAAAIAARLGMDDVVPRGTSIRVDTREAVATLQELAVPDDLDHPPARVDVDAPTQKGPVA